MKKSLSTLLILLFMGVSFNGCEKIKSLADVKFDTDLEADLYITSSGEQGLKSLLPHAFDEDVNLDPKSNEDVYEYWDEIKDIAVKGITLVITDPGQLDNVKIEGTVSVSAVGFTTVEFTVPEWTLVDKATYTVNDSDGKYSKIRDMLNSGATLSIRMWGTASEPSYHFTVKYLSTVGITANPL